MSTILRSGIDLIDVERLARLAPAIRERFLARVFTEAEQQLCSGRDERLAGRFACKEAVAKALGTGIGEVHWRDIEILAEENGSPRLILHGKAQETAETLGLTVWSVSISHIKTMAVALAVASG